MVAFELLLSDMIAKKKIIRDHKEFGIRCKRERFIGMYRYITVLDHNSEGLKCLNADDSVVVCWLVMPRV